MGREWVGGWLHYLGVSHSVTRSERHGCVLKRAECLSSTQAHYLYVGHACHVMSTATADESELSPLLTTRPTSESDR